MKATGTLLMILALGIIVPIGAVYFGLPGETAPQDGARLLVGSQLPALPSYAWSSHRSTLVLVLRTDCRYCRASAPFFRRLAASAGRSRAAAHLLALFPEPKKQVARYLASEGLSVDYRAEIPGSMLGAADTPTLLLADGHGRIEYFWIGRIGPRTEGQVAEWAGIGLSGRAARLAPVAPERLRRP